MSFDLTKLTVTSRRHIPTSFGNKDAFYSESVEIPSDCAVDRSSIYSFLCQRLDLTYLLDYYYSCPDGSGQTPNAEVWPHVQARVDSMVKIHSAFPADIQGILGFNPQVYGR